MVIGGRRGCAIWGALGVVALVVLVAVGFALRWRERAESERRDQAVSLEDQHYEPGDCLTWAQGEHGPESDRAEKVPCSEEHLREVVAVLELDDVEGGFPTGAEWRELKARCHPHVERVLGRYENSVLHPLSRPTISPSAGTWADGDRKLVCEIGPRQVDLAAKAARVRASMRGRAAESTLVSPFEAGDCIRWDADAIGTVPCDQAHQYEVSGIVDLHARATRATTEGKAQRMAWDACPERLDGYFGGAAPAGVSWSWIPVDQDDLDGGVRGLVCLAARFDGREAQDLVGPLRP